MAKAKELKEKCELDWEFLEEWWGCKPKNTFCGGGRGVWIFSGTTQDTFYLAIFIACSYPCSLKFIYVSLCYFVFSGPQISWRTVSEMIHLQNISFCQFWSTKES